ncbi:MAG: hypothetical protein HYU51_04280 [Candidatus Rokubacteria bacterium]|nr:hypothetical protein [Candidatus Rokubacteria bacterium]
MGEHQATCRICRHPIERGELVSMRGGSGMAHLRCVGRRPGARAEARSRSAVCPACGVPMEPGDHVVKIAYDLIHARCYDSVIRRLGPEAGIGS